MPAIVYLVGAGPGDPGLITLKGSQLLSQADVVIYDYLSNAALLSLADPDADFIYVGKKGFDKHITQPEINAIIIEAAQRPDVRMVVRLKGGDPFVFGRGGEEALAMREAGVEFNIVPGITAGISAPAYAGIPVTHRGISTSVAMITGNEDPTKNETSIDWAGIANGAQTLCFYMGIRNLPIISAKLIENGRGADTPVMLIRWGTKQEQEILSGTLDDIAAKAAVVHFKAPAIICVGEAARLSEKLAWFTPGPLAGNTIAVTRSRSQASGMVSQLRQLGATVLEVPTIKFVEPASFDGLDKGIKNISSYQWIVFTSTNGVDYFFKRLTALGKDTRALSGLNVCAIGPATALGLAKHGIKADVVPAKYVAESVLEAMSTIGVAEGTRILIPRAVKAREILPVGLRALGAEVDVVDAYCTKVADGPETLRGLEALRNGEVDAISFTSSSTAENLAALCNEGESFKDLMGGTAAFSIGPVTSETLARLGVEPKAQAQEYTVPGLIAIMENYITVS